jgi:hypothetical protein
MKKVHLDTSRNEVMICSILYYRIWRVLPECTMGHKNVALEGGGADGGWNKVDIQHSLC